MFLPQFFKSLLSSLLILPAPLVSSCHVEKHSKASITLQATAQSVVTEDNDRAVSSSSGAVYHEVVDSLQFCVTCGCACCVHTHIQAQETAASPGTEVHIGTSHFDPCPLILYYENELWSQICLLLRIVALWVSWIYM